MHPESLIRRHFLQFFLPLAALILVSAYLLGDARQASEIGRVSAFEVDRVHDGTTKLLRWLRTPQQHLQSLQVESSVREGIEEASPERIARMQRAFISLLSRNPEYDQARWIDEDGRERVRVNRADDREGITVSDPSQLQDKSRQRYFIDAMRLDTGQTYISALDLNVDYGRVTEPYRPTVRLAAPIADSHGKRRGILIINIDAGSMLQDFKFGGHLSYGQPLTLLNAEGYWLGAADPADEWGFMLGRETTLGKRFPAQWSQIRQSQAGQLRDASGLWTWNSVTPGIAILKAATFGQADEPQWRIVSHLDIAPIDAIRRAVWLPMVLIVVPLLLIVAGLCWLLALRMHRQQEALQARARAEVANELSIQRVAELEAAQVVSARLEAIVNATPDAIIGQDMDGTITHWNAGAERLFGYRADEAIGKSIPLLTAPGQEEEERDTLTRIGRGEVVSYSDRRRRCKDGRSIDVAVTIAPVLDANGQVVGGSRLARDITEAKRIEADLRHHRENLEEQVAIRTAQITQNAAELRERQKFITTVTDNIPVMVGYWDAELRCRFGNRALFEWFGLPDGKMVGMTMQEVMSDEQFQNVEPFVRAALKGEAQRFAQTVRRPGGRVIFFDANYIPDIDQGVVHGFFVLRTDVTQLKQAEGELRDSNLQLAAALERAEAATQAKSQFLANMSHEIRTPMNGVIGMLEILGTTRLEEDQQRIIDTINGSAQSLMQIINDILDFSKIEAGQLRVEMVSTDLIGIVQGTARLFAGSAQAKGLAFRCFVAPSVRGRYRLDPTRLRQILSNLLSNAIKFTARGEVSVVARVVPGAAESAQLSIAVSDTGIGIAAQDQARLFTPFTQADDSTARKFGGTGLGLSISRRLAELMGGQITMHGVENQGTVATLSLPALPDGGKSKASDVDLHGVAVAIVSASVLEQQHFSDYLTHWGAQVTVIDPAPGIAQQLSRPFDVILGPLPLMADIRRAASDAHVALGVMPPRFVTYSDGDTPIDRKVDGDTIVTNALSRARIVTAVAVAASRQSPEIEMQDRLPTPSLRREPPSREQALRDGTLILLAEDHPVNRAVVVRQLSALGYVADVVEDGQQALEALARTPYGLLLTDCNMPVMDGYALARRIRQQEPPGRHLPIVALTANAMDGEITRCLSAGMDDYLSKPVAFAALQEQLGKWMSTGPADGAQDSTASTVQAGVPAAAAPEPLPQEDAPDDNDAAPVLDKNLLSDYFGADQAAADDFLKLYLRTMQGDATRLREAITQQDKEASSLLAHRMKGAALSVGAQRLADAAAAMESSAVSGDWPAIGRTLAEFLSEVRRVERACT